MEFQSDIKVALQRLEEQRLLRIKEFDIESAKRIPEVKFNNFGKNVCILDGILKKCSRTKFCEHYSFCHRK